MNAADASLERLLSQGLLWRGHAGDERDAPRLSSGFEELDAITGGGWPSGALAELISSANLGLSLLVPLLARLSAESRWLAWVNPPWRPHAPALAARGVFVSRLLLVRGSNQEEALWATEQLLASGNCSLVLAWPERVATARIRRLQLAAEAGNCLGVLFRPPAAGKAHSMAALRLRLSAAEEGLRVKVLKRRGGWGGGEVVVPCAG